MSKDGRDAEYVNGNGRGWWYTLYDSGFGRAYGGSGPLSSEGREAAPGERDADSAMRRVSRAACASTHGNDGWGGVAQWDDHRSWYDPSCLGLRSTEANILDLEDINEVLQHKKNPACSCYLILISEGNIKAAG